MENTFENQNKTASKINNRISRGDCVLIAEHSGMSLTTISRFLAGKQEVATETEAKIYAAWQRVLTEKARHFDAMVLEMEDLQSRVDDFKIRLLAAKDSLYKTA